MGQDTRLLFISDLHLEESRPDITAAFLHFLELNRSRCDGLYILGDLFEIWIGDDEESELIRTVTAALADFHEAGGAVFIMHGNRDFLLGGNFVGRCGACLINEPFLLATGAGPVLLLHGDVLCTDDVDYQAFRKLVRQAQWQQEFLARPVEDRRRFAELARQQSQAATADKEAEIMDVNPAAVMAMLRQWRQSTMIHGHTHRPAVHELTLQPAIGGQRTGRRIVLGDWDREIWFVEIDDGELALRNLPLVGQEPVTGNG